MSVFNRRLIDLWSHRPSYGATLASVSALSSEKSMKKHACIDDGQIYEDDDDEDENVDDDL